MTFTIGDEVSWVSQANGRAKRKTGTVVQIVPAGQYPGIETRQTRNAFTRNHVSYYVAVGKKFYWPLVTKLSMVEARQGETIK